MLDDFLYILRIVRGERDLEINGRELTLCQVPSNVVLKRLKPSVWLSTLMVLWGIMMVCIPTLFSGSSRTNPVSSTDGARPSAQLQRSTRLVHRLVIVGYH